jgi:predicted ATPase
MARSFLRFVTLLDVLYEEACYLLCSAQVPPDELFQPLLELAKLEGVNPSLGRSRKIGLNGKPISIELPSTNTDDGRLGERPAGTSPSANKALLQEEVIMYHRASSRIKELCQIILNKCP